ncbi:MAG: hypothetical protein ACK4NW_01555 [Roseinatronobacter sp.]
MPQHTVIIVQYHGTAGLDETMEMMRRCSAHPDFNPGFSHLVDLRGVTDHERDIVGFFKMQAAAIDLFPIISDGAHHFKMVMVAPAGPPREMAELVRRTWAGLDMVLVVILETPEEALELLGIPLRQQTDLLPRYLPEAD